MNTFLDWWKKWNRRDKKQYQCQNHKTK